MCIWGSELDQPFYSHALVAKTLLVEHVVRLVQDKNSQLRDIQLPATNDVHDRARRANNDASADRLATREGTRNRRGDLEVLDETANSSDDTLNLASEFSARGQNQRLGLLGLTEVDPRQYRGNERSRLASSGLRLCQHVSRGIAKHQGQRLALDLGRLQEFESQEALEDGLGAAVSKWSVQKLISTAMPSTGDTYRPRSCHVVAE